MEVNQQWDDGKQRHTRESRSARGIEQKTKHIPSDLFLWAAGASIIGSAALYLMGNKKASIFVGQWPPTFLVLGTYNKMVKLLGSD